MIYLMLLRSQNHKNDYSVNHQFVLIEFFIVTVSDKCVGYISNAKLELIAGFVLRCICALNK